MEETQALCVMCYTGDRVRIFLLMKYRNWAKRWAMNGIPRNRGSVRSAQMRGGAKRVSEKGHTWCYTIAVKRLLIRRLLSFSQLAGAEGVALKSGSTGEWGN